MQLLEIIFVILFGLCFGSFVTLASYRLPRAEGVVAGRSRCPSCKKTLHARDLFPVLSWLLSKGSCRYCHASISWRYPVIELLTAALFLIVYAVHGVSFASVLLMLMSATLVIMVVADLEHMIIPDEVHLALLVLALGYHAVMGTAPTQVAEGFAAMLMLGMLLHHGYYYLRGREGLGFGDVKFFAVAGIWLGLWPLLPFLLITGLLGVMTGLLWRWLGRGDIFPFAPSLALALWTCAVWPNIVIALFYMVNI